MDQPFRFACRNEPHYSSPAQPFTNRRQLQKCHSQAAHPRRSSSSCGRPASSARAMPCRGRSLSPSWRRASFWPSPSWPRDGSCSRSPAGEPEEALHAIGAGVLMHGVYLGGVFWAIHSGMPAGLSALDRRAAAADHGGAGRQIARRGHPAAPLGRPGCGFRRRGHRAVAEARRDRRRRDWPTLAASLVAVAGMSAGTIWQKRFASGGDLVAGTAGNMSAARR